MQILIIGLVLAFLMFLRFSYLSERCPKCGGKMLHYDDNPKHDSCENGCKRKK